ncbi:MAG TPA: hypothetical protein VK421_18905 [Pyrinomonadaceae bacterium]|nr:hypothetical protein [Pyrinomonadaceae bacterium]
MTLPPQGSPHYELRRRIAGCRERLRRNRTAHRSEERATQAADKTGGGSPSADEDEEDGNVPRTRKPARG